MVLHPFAKTGDLVSVHIGEDSKRVFSILVPLFLGHPVCASLGVLVLCQKHLFLLCDTHPGPGDSDSLLGLIAGKKNPGRILAATLPLLRWVSLPITDPIATLFIYLRCMKNL